MNSPEFLNQLLCRDAAEYETAWTTVGQAVEKMARLCAAEILDSTDANLVEDVRNETLLRAHHRLVSYRDEGKLTGWLKTICFHVCQEELRKRRAQVGVDELNEIPAPAEDVANRLISSETRAAVQRCLEQLNSLWRRILVWHHCEDRPIHRISADLRRREGTVKSDLSRARASLSDCVKSSLGLSRWESAPATLKLF